MAKLNNCILLNFGSEKEKYFNNIVFSPWLKLIRLINILPSKFYHSRKSTAVQDKE